MSDIELDELVRHVHQDHPMYGSGQILVSQAKLHPRRERSLANFNCSAGDGMLYSMPQSNSSPGKYHMTFWRECKENGGTNFLSVLLNAFCSLNLSN